MCLISIFNIDFHIILKTSYLLALQREGITTPPPPLINGCALMTSPICKDLKPETFLFAVLSMLSAVQSVKLPPSTNQPSTLQQQQQPPPR